MAASDYVPISFKNRLHLAGRPQMGSRPSRKHTQNISGVAIEIARPARKPARPKNNAPTSILSGMAIRASAHRVANTSSIRDV
jgi:hypothetical protein